MEEKKLLNATEASEFLGLHRPEFYQKKLAFGLREEMQTGRIKLYKLSDIKKMKKALSQ